MQPAPWNSESGSTEKQDRIGGLRGNEKTLCRDIRVKSTIRSAAMGQIVKKVKKWQCKICNEKQSVQKVYYQGSGQDCRVQVQHLNLMKYIKDEKESEALKKIEFTEEDNDDEEEDRKPSITHSKWTKYLAEPHKELCNNIEANDNEEVEHSSSFYVTNVMPEDENEEESENKKVERWLPHIQNNIDDSSVFDRSKNDIFTSKKEPLESNGPYHRTAKNSLRSNLFPYVNDDNDNENNRNNLLTRNGGKRKSDDENDVKLRYEFDNESEFNSPSSSFKRTKFTDETSIRKHNLRDIIKSNRSESKRGLDNCVGKGIHLRNAESVISETNESLFANELTVHKPNMRKITVFQSDCDDLDDNFDI